MKVNPKQLKSFLLETGLVSSKDVQLACNQAQKQGAFFGDILVQKKQLAEEDLRKSFAYILGIPYVNLEKEKISRETLEIIPELIAIKNKVVAFHKNDRELRVAMLNPEDIQTIDFIKKKTGLKIASCLTSRSSMEAVLKQYKKSLQAEFGDIIKKNSKPVDSQEDLKKNAEGLPIIRVVDTLLKHAILQLASDIHIEPDEKELRVRYRIDGILHEAMILPKEALAGIVARIKVLANLKLDEHRIPQDGRFKLEENDLKISFRVSILPVFDGEKVVMRVLNESSKGLTLEDMGLWGLSLERVHRAIKRPNGMILVTGPTGSGKTTTLYTIMDILNTPEVNISTIEDPIEYRMPRINQAQIKPAIGMTFVSGLRALLRQDPDIIMVGEVRDSETMQIALNASMTGHLVLSTLHTNSAATAMPRMLDMKAEGFLIASSLDLVVAQRLVRKICPDCKQEYKLSKEQQSILVDSMDLKQFKISLERSADLNTKNIQKIKNWKEFIFYKGAGCVHCNNEGYRGRVGIFEVLEVSDAIQKMIGRRANADEIEKQAKAEGMLSMFEDGLFKALQGQTSLEDVLRVTQI